MTSLRTWVSDQLHDVAGISDPTIADFFVCLAKKSESGADLVTKIEQTDTLSIDSKVRTFANALFDRIPKSSIAGKEMTVGQKRSIENREKEKAARQMEQQNKSYGLVLSSNG